MPDNDKKDPVAADKPTNPIFNAFKAAFKAIRKEVEDIIRQTHHNKDDSGPKF